MSDTILINGADRRETELRAIETYYLESDSGKLGRRFRVPRDGGFDEYEVVLRLEVGDRVIIRAVHLQCDPGFADVNEAIGRH